MWWPQLIGGIDIEERRPRTFNEPRRKRLNFVRDRKRSSDEWALVSSTNPQPTHHRQRQTQQDLFNRRQWEAQQRFLDQDRQRLFIEQERFRLAHPIPHPPLESWPPRHHQEDPRIQQLPPPPPHHEHGGHPDDIVAVGSEGSNSDDDSDFGGHRGRKPLTIELKPEIRLPRNFRQPGRSKSRGRKDKKKKRRSSPVYSDDSSSENEGFAEGFRAGRRSLSRRPLARKGRSRSRVFELSDDSFEDLALRGRLRSKSRGGWRR